MFVFNDKKAYHCQKMSSKTRPLWLLKAGVGNIPLVSFGKNSLIIFWHFFNWNGPKKGDVYVSLSSVFRLLKIGPLTGDFDQSWPLQGVCVHIGYFTNEDVHACPCQSMQNLSQLQIFLQQKLPKSAYSTKQNKTKSGSQTSMDRWRSDVLWKVYLYWPHLQAMSHLGLFESQAK